MTTLYELNEATARLNTLVRFNKNKEAHAQANLIRQMLKSLEAAGITSDDKITGARESLAALPKSTSGDGKGRLVALALVTLAIAIAVRVLFF